MASSESSGSSDGSGSSSSSNSDSEERRRREKKRRREKREKEKKERKRHKAKHHKHKKHKDDKKDKHKHKKHKKDKKDSGPSGSNTGLYSGWGSHGIIRDSDMGEKQEEFLAWLSEVKGVNQEALRQWELKEHFSSFVEDYNTATLPSEKYYDMRAWYVKDQARKARDASAAAPNDDHGEDGFVRSSFDDEADRRREMLREREKRSQELTKVMAGAMATAGGESSLVQDMRKQEEAKLSMRAAYAVGDVSKAREQAQKLDPKYVSAEELKKVFGGPAPLNSKKPGGMGSGH